MLKKSLILLGLFVVLCAIGFFLFRSAPVSPDVAGGDDEITDTNPSIIPDRTLPEEMKAGFPKGETISLGTQSGSLTVKNFYQNAKTGEEASLVVLEKPSYFISYNTLDSSFWIAITEKPFLEYRVQAEKEFLALLGITQQDACRLNVTVGVPYGADPDHVGKTYYLSFCPGRL